MSISRPFTLDDYIKVKKLHDKYYPQYEFPSFDRMVNAFIIEDTPGNNIIMAGAIELVAEAMLVTNKEMSRIKIGKALVEAQRICQFTCAYKEIKDLYAFTDDNEYASHLKQHGFIDCDRALKLRIT